MSSSLLTTLAATTALITYASAQQGGFYSLKNFAFKGSLAVEGAAAFLVDCPSSKDQPATFILNGYDELIISIPTLVSCNLPQTPSTTARYYEPITDTAVTKCFETGTGTGGRGSDPRWCPRRFGSGTAQNNAKGCLPSNFCPSGFAAAVATERCTLEDSTKGHCPYPKPQGILMTGSSFTEKGWSTKSPPDEILFGVNGTLGLKGAFDKFCPVYDFTVTTSLPTKDPLTVGQVYAVRDINHCNAQEVVKALTATINAYNASEKGKQTPYPAVSGRFSLNTNPGDLKCFNPSSGTFSCMNNGPTGCTMQCPNGVKCNSDKECGARCLRDPQNPDQKVCGNNAFAAVVAPILAAVVAFAFF